MSKLKKTPNPHTALKGRIISALRRLTWTWGPIKEADDEAKVAPATYECKLCGKWCYTGKSVKNYEELKASRPDKNVQMEARYRDHKITIIPIQANWKWSWDEVIENMFCAKSNIQIICKTCNTFKTKAENDQRKDLRKK